MVVRAREIARVDARLEVQGTSTEVQVTEARQVINTEQASVIDSKTSEQIQAIPVNFRAGGTNSIASALSCVPGVQTDGGGSLSLAGNLPYMLTASIDGISSINVRSNGLLTEMFPSADGVDEIKISTTSVNAEYAQVGDITTTSRGGTNKRHGSVFWYHQNGAFVARDFFAVRAPFKVSNDFGGAIGGPVIKNRPFFFFDYEGLRYRAQSNIGRNGYVGAGMLVGPGTVNFSSKVQKRFFVTENAYFQLEGSAVNLMNHANFAAPGLNISASSFGVISATQGQEGSGARQLQVSLRFTF